MFLYTLDNKRYHTLNYEYKKIFKKKVFKVSLNANFSCPNFKNNSGCIFCLHGSNDFDISLNKSLVEQFNIVKNNLEKKWKDAYYIGYFQANTNTYGDLNTLREKYETILSLPNVVGLSIATRSDAISSECYDYLEELNKRTYLTIELGLQSSNENTLRYINRGHSLDNFIDCVKELKRRNIRVVVHIINGIPTDTEEDMINTVKLLNDLDIDGIKIHMLHILKDTPLEGIYNKEHFHILSEDEYIKIVVMQLEYLNPKITIHRIVSDAIEDNVIAPTWTKKKFQVLNDIDKYMKKYDIYQGDKIKGE